MSNVPVTSNENEIVHLAEEHGLIKVAAFISSNTAKQRTKGAERVAKHRQKKKENGLVQVAKLNGIEPSAWLKYTLEKLPVWTMRRIDELLPIKPTA